MSFLLEGILVELGAVVEVSAGAARLFLDLTLLRQLQPKYRHLLFKSNIIYFYNQRNWW